jgi:hypothetical protein
MKGAESRGAPLLQLVSWPPSFRSRRRLLRSSSRRRCPRISLYAYLFFFSYRFGILSTGGSTIFLNPVEREGLGGNREGWHSDRD